MSLWPVRRAARPRWPPEGHPPEMATKAQEKERVAGSLLEAHQETHQQVVQPHPCWCARERVADAREQGTGLGREVLIYLILGQHPFLKPCVSIVTEGTGHGPSRCRFMRKVPGLRFPGAFG